MNNIPKYFLDIPNLGFEFIKPNLIYKDKLDDIITHGFLLEPTASFLTDKAIDWFNKSDFKIKDYIYLFAAGSNKTTHIHCDICYYSFNFILSGYGKMEWLQPYNEPYIDSKQVAQGFYEPGTDTFAPVRRYLRYVQHKNDIILDSWTGTNGFVNIKTPHRIVTGNERRYTVSLRTYFDKNIPWEQAVTSLQQHIENTKKL